VPPNPSVHRETAAALAVAGVLGAGTALSAIQPDDCVAARPANAQPEARCYSLMSAGMKRTLRVYLPAGRDAPLPLIVVLHGGGGSGGGMEWLTQRGFNRIADRDGAIIAYPDGIGHGWNDGRAGVRPGAAGHADDLGYLRSLPRELSSLHALDTARIYVAGISNGGMMSYRLACDAAQVFAAAAPVAANMSVELAPSCQPARAVPLLVINGTDDPIMPWKGGVIRVLWMTRGSVLSTGETIARWLALEHCGTLEPQPIIDADPADGTAVAPASARCGPGGEVSLYEIRGGGHTWPKGQPYLTTRIVGRVSQELDANEAIWAFFRRHSLR
jgi:polyhydroxybutyrate depolymerase